MHTLLQGAVVLGCVLAGLRLRPGPAFALLTGVVVLLPSALQLPNGFTPLPTATRLTALAVAIGLLRQRPGLWRSTPLTIAAGAYAGITLVTGIVLAPPELPLSAGITAWLALLDPLLVGVVAIACARAAGPRAVLASLGGIALLAVGGGLVEHATGRSLADQLVGTGGLEKRAGSSRIRVGSDFALAFAWTMAALTPAVLGLLRRRTWLTAVGVLGCVLVAYWSFSRSVPLGFAVGLVVLALALRDRRTVALVLACGLALGCAALVPTVRNRFTAAVDQGALDVRFQRAPLVLDAASARPVTGLGLGGLVDLDVGETDESFLHTYVETGVLGLTALLVLFGCGLVLVGRGLRGPPTLTHTACAVCLAGASVLVVAGTAFDTFAIHGTAALLGLFLGAGAGCADRLCGPALRVTGGLRVRAALVGFAVLAGIVVAQTWPQHSALTLRFSTLTVNEQSANYDPVNVGRRRVATVCAVAEGADLPGVSVDCVDTFEASGEGRLRLESRHRDDLGEAVYLLVNRVRTGTLVTDLRAVPELPIRTGRPSAVSTAPWSAGLAALLLVLLVPGEPLRRLHARTRRWTWAVEGDGGLPGDPRPLGPTGGIPEELPEGLPEAREAAEHEPLPAEALST